MVVVVLKAATSFAGIDYNERKNEMCIRDRIDTVLFGVPALMGKHGMMK